MLLSHFKLNAQPFGVTPDPEFLFLSPSHREAMASLVHGIVSGRGFTALIAEPGMGKTTLLFNLLHLLRDSAKTAFLFQTLCGPKEFLRALLLDLGIDEDTNDLTRMHAMLNECVLRASQKGRQLVVVVDEAQNLSERTLEVVRMLSNFETPNKKLMQLVLAGQPQFAEKLASEGLRQLRQRISVVARLAAFDEEQTRAYIEHRLRVAGFASAEPLFTYQAHRMIAEHSLGIPRNINNLCFNAMSLGCAMQRLTIDEAMIREVVRDLELVELMGRTPTLERSHSRKGNRRPLTVVKRESYVSSSTERGRMDAAVLDSPESRTSTLDEEEVPSDWEGTHVNRRRTSSREPVGQKANS